MVTVTGASCLAGRGLLGFTEIAKRVYPTVKLTKVTTDDLANSSGTLKYNIHIRRQTAPNTSLNRLQDSIFRLSSLSVCLGELLVDRTGAASVAAVVDSARTTQWMINSGSSSLTDGADGSASSTLQLSMSSRPRHRKRARCAPGNSLFLISPMASLQLALTIRCVSPIFRITFTCLTSSTGDGSIGDVSINSNRFQAILKSRNYTVTNARVRNVSSSLLRNTPPERKGAKPCARVVSSLTSKKNNPQPHFLSEYIWGTSR